MFDGIFKKKNPGAEVLTPELAQQKTPYPAQVTIGDHTYIDQTHGETRFLCINPEDKVTMGKFCSIASEVRIFGGAEHKTALVSTYPLKHFFAGVAVDPNVCSKGNTVIENDVWIGMRAVILSGVHIGNGAVIGAGTIVTHDVPDYAIVAGNPAKLIRYRFAPEQIEELLNIRWWDWPDDRIIENIDYFYGDVDRFIAFARDMPPTNHNQIPKSNKSLADIAAGLMHY